jgi:hypothetical protein
MPKGMYQALICIDLRLRYDTFRENIICTLPVELLTHILSYLEPIDLVRETLTLFSRVMLCSPVISLRGHVALT